MISIEGPETLPNEFLDKIIDLNAIKKTRRVRLVFKKKFISYSHFIYVLNNYEINFQQSNEVKVVLNYICIPAHPKFKYKQNT